jgi:endonuclease YncB( thermonuclease family)
MQQLLEATDAVPEFTLAGKTLDAKVVDCYDGDTFQAVFAMGDQLWKFNCRMAGYDTPEIKPLKSNPNRDVEKANAVKAKQALLFHVCDSVPALEPVMDKPTMDAAIKRNSKIIKLQCKEFDKYGRLLVSVPLSESQTVNDWMVQKGYGYAYDGGKKDATFATSKVI